MLYNCIYNKEIRWSQLKSKRLKRTRGVSFEEILLSEVVAIDRHHSRQNQSIMFFKHKGYIWVVPYVEAKDHIFLKTLYPSRKHMKTYKRGELK